MYQTVKSAAHFGIDGYLVDVEVHIANGLPRFKIVGLPDKAVAEARERVTAAIKSSGYTFPLKRITVNLAPASVPKHGPAFDLPVALGILAASKQIALKSDSADKDAFSGELGLNGHVKPVRGSPILIQTCEQNRLRTLVLSSKTETSRQTKKLTVLGASSLSDVCEHIEKKSRLSELNQLSECRQPDSSSHEFTQILGNDSLKRAAMIAVAGRHNLAIEGPPGTGKTMLANAMIGLFPPMSPIERFEVEKIYSLVNTPIPSTRPFRYPHHTSSLTAITGGGITPVPGELTLAHNGLLFLDEFPLFSSAVINLLRIPLETRSITISRTSGQTKFPCDFLLVTAMNPCPCGYFGHSDMTCTCTPAMVRRYKERIPGAIWDRIDLHIGISREHFSTLSPSSTEPITMIKPQIENARKIQDTRGILNNRIQINTISKYCPMTKSAKLLQENAYQKLQLSTRGLLQITRIARTIADLEQADKVNEDHIAEAISYRRKTNA